MQEISKLSKKLLTEIVKHNDDTKYFKEYFDLDLQKTKYKSEGSLRSAFGELKRAELINILWADNVPWTLSITSKGYTYLKELRFKKTISFLKWIIGTLIAIAAILVPIIVKNS